MKFLLAVLAVVAACSTAHAIPTKAVSTQDLMSDLREFLALIPVDDVVALTVTYMSDDAEFQELLAYIETEEFQRMVLAIEDIPEFQEFTKYLYEAGIPIYSMMESIHEILGIPWENFTAHARAMKITGGVTGYIADVKALIPIAEVKALYRKKLEISPEFADLVAKIESKEFQTLVNKVIDNKDFQSLVAHARDFGLNIELVKDFLSSIFGFEFPKSAARITTFNLQDDLDELLTLVPMDEIIEIVLEYISSDEEVQTVVEFLLSEDFKRLVLKVEALDEIKDLIKFLEGAGIDPYHYINIVHDLLGLDPMKPVGFALPRGKGVRGLIDDVKALLPIEEIKALYYKKLETSPDFAALIEKLKSDEFQRIVDTVMASPEMDQLIALGEQFGVDVELIKEFLSTILGLQFPKEFV